MTKAPQSRAKLKVKWDDPAESKRFLEEAKVAEASEDAADFDRAVKAVAPKR